MLNQSESPIKNLYDKLMLVFDKSSQGASLRLSELIKSRLLDNAIFINASHVPMKTPNANFSTRQIELHESYLSYVWCIAYSLISIIIINDEKARLGNTVVNIGESNERPELNLLLDWALSLVASYSDWPLQIVNPTYTSHRVLQANQLFFETMRYQMYHEVAHLANGHDNYSELVNKIKYENYTPTSQELTLLKQLELEADNYALDCLFLETDSEDDRYLKLLGAVVAHLSDFFILKSSDTRAFRHPDTDVRLFNLINKVALENELYDTYIKHTINVGLQLFMHQRKIPYLLHDLGHKGFESFEELTTELFKIIDQEKHRYSSRENQPIN